MYKNKKIDISYVRYNCNNIMTDDIIILEFKILNIQIKYIIG